MLFIEYFDNLLVLDDTEFIEILNQTADKEAEIDCVEFDEDWDGDDELKAVLGDQEQDNGDPHDQDDFDENHEEQEETTRTIPKKTFHESIQGDIEIMIKEIKHGWCNAAKPRLKRQTRPEGRSQEPSEVKLLIVNMFF